jgi:hypothetical protein
MEVVYTRYVDDITFSAKYDLEKSGLPELLSQLLNEHGFRPNTSKHFFGELSASCITGIRVRNGRLDVNAEYAVALEEQLDEAHSLAQGGAFHGHFYTLNQLRGKIQFVAWINPGRRARLLRKLFSISPQAHRDEAMKRGLVAQKPRLFPKVLHESRG